MANYDQLPVFRDAYTLTLLVSKTVSSLPKVFKFNLGGKLEAICAEVLDQIVIANHSKDKKRSLQLAILNIERLRIQARILFDLHGFSMKRYEQISKHCVIIKRQLSGWEKWSNAPSSAITTGQDLFL